MASDKWIQYEAEHAAYYHCPCENEVELAKYIEALKQAWRTNQLTEQSQQGSEDGTED